MIRRTVLAALSAGAEAGDDAVARQTIARADPLLRGPARRRLEHALIDAALVSGGLVSAADPSAVRHVQQVAALTISGRYEVDATDRAGVSEAFRALPRAYVPRLPIATIFAALSVVCVCATAWFAVHHRSHHSRMSSPPGTGAYLTGGVPAYDRGLAELFIGDLADLSVTGDHDRHGDNSDDPTIYGASADHDPEHWQPERVSLLRRLREAPEIAAHGPELVAAWNDMLTALDHWLDEPLHARGYHDAETELRLAAHAVSDQFAALGVGYYVEASVFIEHHAAHAALLAYRVERVSFVQAGDKRHRVLELRRLDPLDVEHPLLGMESSDACDPMVLLDQVDEFTVHKLEPVVSGGDPYQLGDGDWLATSNGHRLAAAAGAAVRRELVGRDLVSVVATGVRHHEAQHAFDAERDDALSIPPALRINRAVVTDPFVRRTNAELSAYASQIASERVAPQLALWNLASHAFNHHHEGSPEAIAGAVVIEALAKRFGVVGNGRLYNRGRLDRDQLAALALPLTAVPDDQLREAARAVWSQLYGEPYETIVDQPVVDDAHE